MSDLFFSFTKGMLFGAGSKFIQWILERNKKEKTTLLTGIKEWFGKKKD
ncbi:TPA: hypothetical protein ACGXP4_006060 [Bacillus cereus]